MENEIVAEESANVDLLDNFDTRTPDQVEADAAAADEIEDEKPAKPEETQKTKSEEEKPEAKAEEPAKEVPKYQPPQKINLQAPKFEMEIPRDEYGNIDPEKFGEYLQARDEHLKQVARIEAQNAYYEQTFGQREWADVESQYGDLLKEVPDARDTIESLRVADAIRGGEGLLMSAAEKLNSMLSSQKQQGIESQQKTITRQKSVKLDSSTRTTNASADRIKSLRNRALSGGVDSDSARRAYISELYDSGALGN